MYSQQDIVGKTVQHILKTDLWATVCFQISVNHFQNISYRKYNEVKMKMLSHEESGSE